MDEIETPAFGLNKGPSQREPDPVAFLIGAPLKERRERLVGNTRAIIGHRDGRTSILGADVNPDFAAAVPQRIRQEDVDRLSEGTRASEDLNVGTI